MLVRALVPPLHRKGDPLDIEVSLPNAADSEATSLRGGWLMPCGLFESKALQSGRGPSRAANWPAASAPCCSRRPPAATCRDAPSLRRGTIPAGGKFIGGDLSVTLNLRTDYRTVRMAERIADTVGRRFHGFDEYGVQVPMTEAKTDSRIVLDIPEAYEDNPARYLKVIKRIHLKETPLERRLRMEALRGDLLDPRACEQAAFELEAIGREAKPILKEALAARLATVPVPGGRGTRLPGRRVRHAGAGRGGPRRRGPAGLGVGGDVLS